MATTLEAEVGLKSGSLYPILMRLADRGSWTLLGR
jgi:DNA-binding PadR family transcriptional regulator